MLLIKSLESGRTLDITPGQEITFTLENPLFADDRMPDDHIGLMLSLLATLTEERPELVEEYLSEHLLPWAPHYLGLLEVCAEHPFYKGLALLTKATLKGAQGELSLVVIEPRFYR